MADANCVCVGDRERHTTIRQQQQVPWQKEERRKYDGLAAAARAEHTPRDTCCPTSPHTHSVKHELTSTYTHTHLHSIQSKQPAAPLCPALVGPNWEGTQAAVGCYARCRCCRRQQHTRNSQVDNTATVETQWCRTTHSSAAHGYCWRKSKRLCGALVSRGRALLCTCC